MLSAEVSFFLCIFSRSRLHAQLTVPTLCKITIRAEHTVLPNSSGRFSCPVIRASACATGLPPVVGGGRRPEGDVQGAEKALKEPSLSPLNVEWQHGTAAVSRTVL